MITIVPIKTKENWDLLASSSSPCYVALWVPSHHSPLAFFFPNAKQRRLPVTHTLLYFSYRSFRKHRRASSSPHHYPLALAVNKSPAVYILSPTQLKKMYQ